MASDELAIEIISNPTIETRQYTEFLLDHSIHFLFIFLSDSFLVWISDSKEFVNLALAIAARNAVCDSNCDIFL